MIVLGQALKPFRSLPLQLLFGSVGVEGALTGSPIDNEDTLGFSLLQGIKPMIETVRWKGRGRLSEDDEQQARFRIVLTMGTHA
jgi:hypothetical protein